MYKKKYISIKYIILLCMMISFSYVSYGAYNVTGSEDWNLPQYMATDVIIHNGGFLTINADVYFSPTYTITVEVGGELVVNNSVLGCAVSNELWGGIRVFGNKTLPQNLNNNNQGKVFLNFATIENAEIGVLVGRRYLDQLVNGLNLVFVKGGGIVIANNTDFINNKKAVHFNQYKYRDQITGNEYNNISQFTTCNFITDDNAYFIVGDDESQVSLFEVRGVNFDACTFNSAMSGEQGIGLYSNASGVNINTCGLFGSFPYYSDKSFFLGYKQAIHIKQSGTCPVNILNTEFSGNEEGVRVNLVNNLRIESCVFTGNLNSLFGIILENSTNYFIENNIFNNIPFMGILISGQCTDNNFIKYNTFSNNCIAVAVNGHQSNQSSSTYNATGLQFFCNFFNGNEYDIYINYNSSIRFYQGDDKNAPQNLFGPITSSCNIYNGGNYPIIYYYMRYSNPFLKPANIYGSVLLFDANLTSCRGVGASEDYYNGRFFLPENELNDVFIDKKQRFDIIYSEYIGMYNDTIHWNDYFAGDTSYQQQVNHFKKLTELKDSLDILCSEAIQLLLSDDMLDVSLYKTWISRIESPSMDFLLAECYLNERDTIMFDSVLSNISNKYPFFNPSYIEQYTMCLDYLFAWNSYYNDTVFISQGTLDTLYSISNGTNISSALAQAIIERIGFEIEYRTNFGILCEEYIDLTLSPSNIMNINIKEIEIKPNPTFNFINLNSNSVIKKIIITDIYGKQILSKEINSNEINIDISKYSNGVYFINCIMNDGSSVIKKVIKE